MIDIAGTLTELMDGGKLSPGALRALLDHNHIDLVDYLTAMKNWDREKMGYFDISDF